MFLVPVLFFTHPTGLGLRKNIFFYHILSLQRGFLVSTDRVHLLLLSLLFLFYLVFIFQGNWQQFILSTLVTAEKTIFGSREFFFEKDANVMGQDDPASRSHCYMPCEHNGD